MQTEVWSLWLPVVVSGVALFFASWAAWMLLPHHKSEWKGLPNEEAVASAVKRAEIAPGQYMFPYSNNPEDWKSPAFKARLEAGPNGSLCIWRGPSNMGLNMLCTLLYFLAASFVIAYLAGMALPPGSDAMTVFRFASTAGLLGYAGANILNGIWFRRKLWGDIVDGVAYALITGIVFASLWPAAAT